MSFKQLIASPTRMVEDSASLVDLIATNCPQNISNFGVASLHLSDHELVYCIRKLNWKKAPAQMKTFRNYANYGSSEFRRDLAGIDWNLNSIDGQTARVNELWDHFKTSLVSAADKHAPVIHKRVRGVDVCPWLNKNIKINMRRRHFLLKKARKTINSEDWTNYRCCRNGVSNSIRKAKASYNHRLIKDSGKDHKAFWKTMKKILPGEKTAISPKINTGQSITTDKKTIASAFNNFFVGAATRLLECLPYAFSSSTGSQNIHHRIAQHPAFRFDKVSEDCVKAELRALKTGKAMGLDNIPARLLIDSADIVAKPLAEMINCSLKSGRVPLDFKSTRVILLFKKGKVVEMDLHDRTQFLDFQGVSSDLEPISIGVPQGSILGLLLFMLHVNDLLNVVNRCSMLMYADDTVLFYPASKVDALQERLNEELKAIECWLRQNSLFSNVYKTEAMVFGASPRLSNIDSFTIGVNGSSIKRVSQFKYLGVVFDERLSWNDHVKFILAKAGKRVGMLGRIRYCITWHSVKIIYTSMIRPIIEYCDTCGDAMDK